ncbi:MAG TPA: hypothetical protein VKU19_36570 [Bryobacteraceae bacterium]|nr:hypothetical protein [Bryobacteraceae bacterium]
MASPIALVSHRSTQGREIGTTPAMEERAEFVETPQTRNRSTRGLITGVVLGTGLWGVILVAVGVIKL